MYYEILDPKRIDILPKFKLWQNRFYLAGGTALALHYGHRDSIDFDFFTFHKFDEQNLVSEINQQFVGNVISVIQLEPQTITILIDNEVKVSFMYYEYSLLEDFIIEDNINVASVIDIACMKCAAICSRSVSKDYIDLYFIIKQISLKDLLASFSTKYNIDTANVLKALVFFNDIEMEPVHMIIDVTFEDVKTFLLKEVKCLIDIKG